MKWAGVGKIIILSFASVHYPKQRLYNKQSHKDSIKEPSVMEKTFVLMRLLTLIMIVFQARFRYHWLMFLKHKQTVDLPYTSMSLMFFFAFKLFADGLGHLMPPQQRKESPIKGLLVFALYPNTPSLWLVSLHLHSKHRIHHGVCAFHSTVPCVIKTKKTNKHSKLKVMQKRC